MFQPIYKDYVVITSDAVLEIVIRHFDKISPAQWHLLANGSWDVETKQILLSLFIQLVQTLSAKIFRLWTGKCSSLEETSRASETIAPVLKEPMGEVFAQALNVKALPDDMEEYSRELTVMLQNEISQKVNCMLFIASSGLQSQSPIMVDSSLSSWGISHAMLHNAKHCLGALLAFFCCPRCKFNTYRGDLGEKSVETTARAASDSAVEQNRVGQCKNCFTSYAKLQFKRMKESLSCKSVHVVMGAGCCGVSRCCASKRTYSLSSLEVNFEAFQRDIDQLFEKLQFFVRPETVSNQSFQDFINGDEIGWFSKRLTNKIGREISEGIQAMGQNVVYSPQPIAVMVQDQVARFIQKLVYFMQEPPKNGFFNYDLLEKSMSQSRSSVSTPSTPSYPVSPMSMPRKTTPSIASSIDVGTPKSSTNSALSQSQIITQYLITALFTKILPSLSPGDKGYRAAVERLTQKAWEEIYIPEDQAKATEKRLRKVIKAVMKDLLLEYGSFTQLMAKATDPKDNTFEDNLVKYLKIHLDVFLKDQKKPAVARFFSETWRIIKKPFCCFT